MDSTSRSDPDWPKVAPSRRLADEWALVLIAEGLSSKEIGEVVGVAFRTVESYRASLMDKLDIHKVAPLVRFAIREGLVDA